ncbi:CDP-alcohol phosphatidyltransferase family protein [Rhodohalobacter mucosus]|uniref:CDP-diacylglycerol--glycerol-3-phosphate 3-phosphatidyltransferase n=2 Tax=Rhodohalobacter mucosus TaxID=2079485 RepID=A0A316TSQ2_9BACT|nr:CDP-alcohol phosphatidyltransferase family protein [Rhodohalobacter mucosus]
MAMAPVFLLLYIQDDIWLRGISLVIFAVAALTDFFDGYIARKYRVESKFGIFLDPLADKFLTIAGFVCLPFLSPEQFPWWAIVLIVIRDLGITGLRIFADRRNLTMQTRSSAKVKTAIQMIYLYTALLFGFLVLFGGGFGEMVRSVYELDLFYWGMIAVTAITVYSGIEYLAVNRKMFVTTAGKNA